MITPDIINLLIGAASIGGPLAWIVNRRLNRETTRAKKIENEISILHEVEKDNQRLRERVTAQDVEIKTLKNENAELRKQIFQLHNNVAAIFRMLPPDIAARLDSQGGRDDTQPGD